MKRVFIIHGWGGSPKEPMIAWLTKNCNKHFETTTPEMPETDNPQIKKWIPKLKEIVKNPNDETYFIGHSIGCQTILRYLESLPEKKKVGGAILIAPWFYLSDLETEEEKVIAKEWTEKEMNFKKILSHTKDIVCIFSEDDEVVPLANKDSFKKNLGAKIIIEKNKGHFTEDDGVVTNETALRELLKLSRI